MESLIKRCWNFFKKFLFFLRERIDLSREIFAAVFRMDHRDRERTSDSSDSSSDESDSSDYVLYRDRPEWKDVRPIPQDDGPVQVVRIAYSEKFSDVFDYFRAVLTSGEKSTRALNLVSDAISLNPANYTLWIYRLEIVLFLNLDLHNELQYISDIIREFTKNYQVWQYRKNIVEMLNDPSSELEFTASILDMDAKNYHAWQYRQWVLTTFSHLFEKELDFVDSLLSHDMRNNSAWNQRYFVINNSNPDSDTILRELKYTFNKIEILSKNESAWNYLRGLLLYSENGELEVIVRDFCDKLYAKGNRSTYLLSFLIDLLDADEKSTESDNIQKVKFALKLCSELATVYDPMRRFYWAYISSDIENKFNIHEHDTKINVVENTTNGIASLIV